MKKRKFKSLKLKKESISKLKSTITGGGPLHHTCQPNCTQTAQYTMCGNRQCY